MDYILPRPWECKTAHYTENTIWWNGALIATVHHDKSHLQHIVKCVNEYDSLNAEIKRLKEENEKLNLRTEVYVETILQCKDEIDKLKEKIEELKINCKTC